MDQKLQVVIHVPTYEKLNGFYKSWNDIYSRIDTLYGEGFPPITNCEICRKAVQDNGATYTCSDCKIIYKYPPVPNCWKCHQQVVDIKGNSCFWCQNCKSTMGKILYPNNKWYNVRRDIYSMDIILCDRGTKSEVKVLGRVIDLNDTQPGSETSAATPKPAPIAIPTPAELADEKMGQAVTIDIRRVLRFEVGKPLDLQLLALLKLVADESMDPNPNHSANPILQRFEKQPNGNIDLFYDVQCTQGGYLCGTPLCGLYKSKVVVRPN